MAQQPSYSDRLQQLSHGRWFVPLLSGIGSGGTRSVELRQSLGLSASMLRRSLEQMQNQGWIMPNPGHGHPLRPEWVTTEKGATLIASCQAIMAERRALGLPAAGVGRWHLPLITQLIDQEKRFGELQNALSPVTPRALSLALKRSMALGQVERRLEADFPPMAIYGITDKARPLAEAASTLTG
jgi:DNA-binding HxlR family transcriptional regulator